MLIHLSRVRTALVALLAALLAAVLIAGPAHATSREKSVRTEKVRTLVRSDLEREQRLDRVRVVELVVCRRIAE